MAWWGVAYARGLPINNPLMTEEQGRLADEAARQALLALDDESPVERALVQAVRERYVWPAPEERRPLDEAYAVAAEMGEEWMMGNNTAAEVLAIARRMAVGELAYHQGAAERAFTELREAVALEDALRYDEPPGWMQPVRHALGALLLADGRFGEAEAVYRADLERRPRNAWSLLGLQQALTGQDRSVEAETLADAVAEAWSRADVNPVASC